jgi:hypothetical protein
MKKYKQEITYYETEENFLWMSETPNGEWVKADLAEEMLAVLKEAYKYLNEEVRTTDDSELLEIITKVQTIITKAEEA